MKSLVIIVKILFITLIFSACNAPPKDDFIKDSIYNRYSIMSLSVGGGTYNVIEIKILSKKKLQNTKEWNVKAEVKGNYKNGSIPDGSKYSQNFNDTVNLIFYKQTQNSWQYRDF
ncbi:MAG: hypothetical protein HUU47_01670 [Bacteroidetes bacterium]|nr:hypothetical protein [Bacteroidota bacterium]